MEVYEVGGAVRDSLLGRPVTERDWVVVGSSPEEMIRLGYRPVGRDFPVFLHPRTGEEYALARTERKTGPGYKGFAIDASPDTTLEEDLGRRDLTVNAIARDESGELIDPFGGRRDIEQRVLRHVSEAFREDPVRVLRAARFAAQLHELDFRVADETLALMREIGDRGELDALQPERVWQETHKALCSANAEIFFETLRACGALALIYPEIDRLYGVPQPKRWHPEVDTGLHTMLALREASRLSESATVRFAALVHDLGKGTTPKAMLPSHRGHEARSVDLVEALCARLRIPKRFEALAVLVARHHGSVHRAAELRAATIHDLLTDLGALRDPERFEEFLLACEADARGRTGLEQAPYPQAEILRRALAAASSVASDRVPSETPGGPAFGAALRELRIAAIRDSRTAQPPP